MSLVVRLGVGVNEQSDATYLSLTQALSTNISIFVAVSR